MARQRGFSLSPPRSKPDMTGPDGYTHSSDRRELMAAATSKENDRDGERSKQFLSQAIGPLKRRLQIAGLLLVTADLIWIGQAYIIAVFCADLLIKAQEPVLSDLSVLIAAFLGLALVRVLAVNLSESLAFECSTVVRDTARSSLVKRAGNPLHRADRLHSGELAVIASSQVEALDGYIRSYLPARIRIVATPTVIVLAVLPISWIAAMLLLVAGPLIPLFMVLIGSGARKASEKHLEEMGRLGGFLLDRLQGLTTLRLLGALDRTEEGVFQASDRFRQRTMAVLRIAFLSSTVLEFFAALGVAFVAVFVGFSLLGTVNFGHWGTPLTYQAGFFILLVTPDFFAPFRAFATAFHDKAAAQAAAARLGFAIDRMGPATDRPVEESAQAKTPEHTKAPALCGSGLRSGFESEITTPSGIHFSVTAGERIALMGPSGSGKSTLLSMIMGFHRPVSGTITVDGQPLSDFASSDWLRRCVLIGQKTHLFHGSLRYNLSIAKPGATEAELINALSQASAAELAEKLPAGLNTQLGENGFGLSVGQQRRVAIARAFLKPAGLVLADEPTADLDQENAQKVLAGLAQLARGRTLIVATHDQSVCHHVDRTLVFEAGQLRERVPG